MKRMAALPLTSIFSVALTMISCNFNKQKGDTDNGAVEVVNNADLNFNNLKTKVFSPYCLSCHSAAASNVGNVNLETYAKVISQIELVQASVLVEHRMPPSGALPLSANAYALLKAWIEAGAPE